MKKLKTFDSIYFRGKSCFEEHGTQNYLVFQAIQRYFKIIASVGNRNHICYWKSKGLSNERSNSIETSAYGINPYLRYGDTNKIRVKFDGGCLKQDPGSLLNGGIVNVYIVYEKGKNDNISDCPTLENCLFGAVSLTKNTDIDKYGYSCYGTAFDRQGSFSFSGTRLDKNVIVFGTDMSSSTKIDSRKKDIIILGKGPTQGLEHKKFFRLVLQKETKFCLSLNYNKENSYLFVNGTEIIKFKSKDPENFPYPLCLGNI